MEPEQKARRKIDKLLEAAGWVIQDYKDMNLGASLGVVIREFPLKEGRADYLLFADREVVGVVEAKSEGTTLSTVADQSEGYLKNTPENLPHARWPPPFAYETTGVETRFRDNRDPRPRSRNVFAFHKPETLLKWANQRDTLRARLTKLPALPRGNLRDCQFEAITKLEQSFAKDRPRALIQMATGSGKTFTAVSEIYRLIKFGGAKRVLFLVDRNNLARQTLREFQQYVPPDSNKHFTDIYNVQHLRSNKIDPVANVCITTIQRLYAILSGKEIDEEAEEHSMFEASGRTIPITVDYNPATPIETFDFIVSDECHRSIYNLWRQVLEYFDCYLVGLTATPSLQTVGFFNNNLVMEYNHEKAVADGVNVQLAGVYRIETKISKHGNKVNAGYYVDVRDKFTRERRMELLDKDMTYEASKLDRSVVSPSQIRTVIREFRDKLKTEIFPGRTHVPKTLVFTKNDAHAEDVVNIMREEFGEGNDFCKKITYRSNEKPEDILQEFRNSYYPRIAVTVDMVATGTDIKPLECLLFLRDVNSRLYFEQMKGRGTRTISKDDMASVTPDAGDKTQFVIVDAVGVCEKDKTDTKPLDRKPTVAFEKLVMDIAKGIRDEDTIGSMAGRLAKLDRKMEELEKQEFARISGGKTVSQVVSQLLAANSLDNQLHAAKEMFKTNKPDEAQVAKARKELITKACLPLDKPALRNYLVDVKREKYQIIDTVSQDVVLRASFDSSAKDKAQAVVGKFKDFIEQNKNEISALQIIYARPYGQRHLTYQQIKDLADAIAKPPYYLNSEVVWNAYKQLDKSRVHDAGPKRLLTDIISLVRYAVGESESLSPYPDFVESRFKQWLAEQKKTGQTYNATQMEWLGMIKEHIASSASIEIDDFEYAPFIEKGGAVKASKVFGPQLDTILKELNEALPI